MSQSAFAMLETSREDISAYSEEIASGQIIRFEDFAKDSYLDSLIEKPWGHEYRVYADMLIDVWKLTLAPGQSTSMHCHPRKETVLMCLEGNLRINFLNRSVLVSTGQYARIPKGVFHSTDNLGETDAHLVEVETPRNKFDLIRKKDRYGRQGQQYEANKSASVLGELEEDPTQPFAKIRRHDLQGVFNFKVQTGREIQSQHATTDFAVSLSVEAAIGQRIEIFHAGQGFTFLNHDARYLAIGQV